MKISEICVEERPREKVLSKGAGALSNAELLSVFLRTGYGGENAIDLGHRLLNLTGGSLVRLERTDVERLCDIPGVKESKVAAIKAAFELGRRFCAEETSSVMTPLLEPKELYDVVIPYMKGLDHEECRVVLLNPSFFFISQELITTGASNTTVIDIPRIVRSALSSGAAAVVLTHNHPSANPRPSKADIKQTRALKDALSQVGLSLLDHIIVCDESYYSFAEERTFVVR